jgi:methylated-DNA-[protein]-cysteine S-methyltransferase
MNTDESLPTSAPIRSKPAAARLAIAQARTDTPLGPVTLAATARGLCGLWFDGQQHHPGALDAPVDASQRFIAQALEELARYWATPARGPAVPRGGAQAAGRGRTVLRFAVPIDLLGTPFQRSVWTSLQRIAPGTTASYGEVARASGHGAAVRAVGVAIGRNPLSIIVPCHRVIGRDGSLTGYAGGLERKRRLLDLEATAVAGGAR